ncbi:hypothetical protein KKG29_03510 [Patescibacteria group bacterium]|nr:hypothetical protein [Patescibacteria group bacterium]MBU4000210.1 hypothetical protein [Patescibacteria group bacterium]MBU4056620.1 hypothetical protein [Patescibacteria group bacterium]MBU4368647.1 hypothetical protein [Patescibacteria group bacterium]
MTRKEKKTIRQKINEADSLAGNEKIDEAIIQLISLLKEEHGKPTIEETIELVDTIASLKKRKYEKEDKKTRGEKKMKTNRREDLVRQQIEFAKKLCEISPGMAKKVIAATNLEIARLEKLQSEAEKIFNRGRSNFKAGFFSLASADFTEALSRQREIGDIEGEASSFEMQAKCCYNISGMLVMALNKAREAIKIYKKIDNADGVARVKALIKKH